jgi:hypothetical protein
VSGIVIVPAKTSVINSPSSGGMVSGAKFTEAPPSLAVTALPDGA